MRNDFCILLQRRLLFGLFFLCSLLPIIRLLLCVFFYIFGFRSAKDCSKELSLELSFMRVFPCIKLSLFSVFCSHIMHAAENHLREFHFGVHPPMHTMCNIHIMKAEKERQQAPVRTVIFSALTLAQPKKNILFASLLL